MYIHEVYPLQPGRVNNAAVIIKNKDKKQKWQIFLIIQYFVINVI